MGSRVSMDVWKVENSLPNRGNTYFPFPNHSDQLCSLCSLLFNRHWGSFPGVKQLRCDSDHSPQPRTEVKNKYSYTSAPPICICGLDRVKFTFNNYLTWKAQLWVKFTQCMYRIFPKMYRVCNLVPLFCRVL